MNTTTDSAADALSRRERLFRLAAPVIFLLAVVIRLPLAQQSFWYDELYTIQNFMARDYAAVAGEPYSVNNHILFTLLAKIGWSAFDQNELVARLPSVLLGAGVGLAIAWPLRRKSPLIAVVIAAFASASPWLLVFSSEARGYAMALLLCAVGTNLLPERRGLPSPLYALVMAAAMYTQPICAAVLVGHAFAMLALRRSALSTWAMSASLAVLAAMALYWPVRAGMLAEARQAQGVPLPYPQFIASIPWHLLLGFLYSTNTVATAAAGAVVLIAIRIAWSIELALRPMTVTFTIAGFVAAAAALASPNLAQARFALWFLPPFAVGVAMGLAMLATVLSRGIATGRWPMLTAWTILLLLYVGTGYRLLLRIPAQPIREALADAEARPTIGIYMASLEAGRVYPGMDVLAMNLEQLKLLTGAAPAARLIVFYPEFLARAEPTLRDFIAERYRLDRVLPGRISDVQVWEAKAGD